MNSVAGVNGVICGDLAVINSPSTLTGIRGLKLEAEGGDILLGEGACFD
jgi:hypothetical protein